MKERLQKAMARAGYGSRRTCEELIRSGRVLVNDTVSQLGDKVDLAKDMVIIDGRKMTDPETLVYFILNKPTGYLSSTRSQGGNPTVLDLVSSDSRIYPVGRLDMESEGLLLLTNDGELTNVLTHPRFAHQKEYRVLLDQKPNTDQLKQWKQGVLLQDGYRTKPVKINLEGDSEDGCWVRIVMTEGRKRQIRETAGALGLNVVRLVRVRMANLELGDLPIGKWRRLEQAEIEALQRMKSAAS
jgi:23S rRNA pseudouridine2605 synthase